MRPWTEALAESAQSSSSAERIEPPVSEPSETTPAEGVESFRIAAAKTDFGSRRELAGLDVLEFEAGRSTALETDKGRELFVVRGKVVVESRSSPASEEEESDLLLRAGQGARLPAKWSHRVTAVAASTVLWGAALSKTDSDEERPGSG